MAKSPVAILYDSDGNPIGVALDGSVYRLQMSTKVARASDGAFVNPATQETLAAIKDTDGVKKIVDALPVGDNIIGRTKVTDGTNVLGVDAQNAIYVGGKAAPGVAPSSNPVSVSGVDEGGLKRALLTDTSGRLYTATSSGGYGGQVEGRAADGATPVGYPVYVAGQDGTNIQALKTDSTGRQEVVGGAADGSAPAGNPVLIAGSDNTNVQTVLTDTKGRIIIAPPGTTASTKGFADGFAVLAATAAALLFSTTYTEQTSNAQRSLVSASASDAAAGTGARKVIIRYYTATFTGPFEEEVTLNGTTPVNTVATDICYVECMRVSEAGNGASIPVGIISLKAATGGGGATIWTIAAGAGQTFGAIHYVPTGQTCFITGFYGGIKGGDSAGFYLRAQDLSAANKFNRQVSDTIRVVSNSSFLRTYGTPIEVVGPARIQAWVVPDSTSSRTYYGSFDYYDQSNT